MTTNTEFGCVPIPQILCCRVCSKILFTQLIVYHTRILSPLNVVRETGFWFRLGVGLASNPLFSLKISKNEYGFILELLSPWTNRYCSFTVWTLHKLAFQRCSRRPSIFASGANYLECFLFGNYCLLKQITYT